MSAQPTGFRAPLARRDFRLLWLAQTISDLGDGLTNLALLLLALKLTGSPAAVAATLIVLELPQVTIGLVAGVFVDRWERRRVMLASDLLRAALVVGFVAVGSSSTLWLLFVLAIAQASVGTFFSPARTALVATLLPQDELFAANSLGQLSRVLAYILGESAAGVLVGLTGAYWPAFVVDGLTFLFSVALVSRVAVRSIAGRTGRSNVGSELREGLAYVRRSPVLVGTLLAAGTAYLGIGAVNVLWIPLFQNDLHVPTALFGAADLAQAAAMIIGAGFSIRLVRRAGPTRIVTAGLAALGAAVALTGLVTSFWQVLVLLFLIGAIVSPLQAAVTTIVQVSTDEDVRGRVAAALSSVTSSANILSMGLAGLVSAQLGVRGSFGLAGGAIAASSLVALVLFQLARSGRRAEPQPARAPQPE